MTRYGLNVNDDQILGVLRECAESISTTVTANQHRGYSGQRETQYHLDLAADEAALAVLLPAGFRVVSEESGVSGSGQLTVVIDPIDGSTNCDRGIPFYATSLAVLRDDELVAGLVVNQVTQTYFEAIRGAGATRDGNKITTSGCTEMSKSLVAFSGLPSRHIGWAQIRALGAASLECCLVADGSLDVFAVAQRSYLHPWDYLAGVLIAREAGAHVGEYDNENLIIDTPTPRRPVFASSSKLLETMMTAGAL